MLVASLAASTAFARGLHQIGFRLDVLTGEVRPRSRVTPPPVLPWPSPLADPRRSTTHDQRTVIVQEGDPAAPGPWRTIWTFTLPGSDDGRIAWEVVQGSTVAFAWRARVPGQQNQYRDTIRAVEMHSRTVLWEQVEPAHGQVDAVAVGTDYLVVDRDREVRLLETRTGRLVRRIAKSEPSFAVTRPGPGRVWVEAGDVIECIDERTMKTVWRVSKQERLLWLLPIPGSDDWLVKTAGHAYRLHAADGRLVWSARSTSASRPLLSGNRAYEATLVRDPTHKHAQMSVIARDLQSGDALREYALGSYDHFFDQGSVAAVEARDGWVDVAAELVILD